MAQGSKELRAQLNTTLPFRHGTITRVFGFVGWLLSPCQLEIPPRSHWFSAFPAPTLGNSAEAQRRAEKWANASVKKCVYSAGSHSCKPEKVRTAMTRDINFIPARTDTGIRYLYLAAQVTLYAAWITIVDRCSCSWRCRVTLGAGQFQLCARPVRGLKLVRADAELIGNHPKINLMPVTQLIRFGHVRG